MKDLNLLSLSNGSSKNIKIGELSSDVINTLGLNLNPQNIYVWTPRIQEHCEKHKSEYSSPESYYSAIKSIPEIIKNPDYVGIHSNGNIQYVKKIDDISLVGVKLVKQNGLLFRTIYPITDDKLNHYIRTNKIKPIKKE
mgnify:CR=1 FL=1